MIIDRLKRFPKSYISYMNRMLADKDVNFACHPYLFVLSEFKSMNIVELTNYVHFDKAHTSRILKKMQKEDLVKIASLENDARAKIVSLTKRGRAISDLSERYTKEWEELLFEGLSDEEILTFTSVLDKMIVNANKQENNN